MVDTVDLHLVSGFKWYSVEKEEGTIYAQTNIGKSTVQMQRLILGRPKGKLVDHRDRDGLNNRRSNLRVCEIPNLNNANSKKYKSNTSGFKGVSWHAGSGKWRAVIGFKRKIISLGLHDTPEKAHKAYMEKAQELYGEFARAS